MEQEIRRRPEGSKGAVSDKALLSVQAALSAIPYAGGFLATYFGDIRSKRMEERINRYIEHFKESLQKLDQEKIDYAYLETEEFAELFVQGAEQAARSTTQKKIKRFANILANNVVMDSSSRPRTQSIMSFVNRLTDLDAFVLISYGDPSKRPRRADSKEEAIAFVRQLAEYLGIHVPSKEHVIQSIIYMDNLGLTWINERSSAEGTERGESLVLKEFSSFRTPLGDELAKVIIPPDFEYPPIWGNK